MIMNRCIPTSTLYRVLVGICSKYNDTTVIFFITITLMSPVINNSYIYWGERSPTDIVLSS